MRHAKTNPGSALLRFGALLLVSLCLLGTGLLLTAAYALHRYFSSDITDKEN